MLNMKLSKTGVFIFFICGLFLNAAIGGENDFINEKWDLLPSNTLTSQSPPVSTNPFDYGGGSTFMNNPTPAMNSPPMAYGNLLTPTSSLVGNTYGDLAVRAPVAPVLPASYNMPSGMNLSSLPSQQSTSLNNYAVALNSALNNYNVALLNYANSYNNAVANIQVNSPSGVGTYAAPINVFQPQTAGCFPTPQNNFCNATVTPISSISTPDFGENNILVPDINIAAGSSANELTQGISDYNANVARSVNSPVDLARVARNNEVDTPKIPLIHQENVQSDQNQP